MRKLISTLSALGFNPRSDKDSNSLAIPEGIPTLGATLEFQVATVIKASGTNYASAVQQTLIENLKRDISFGSVQTTIARLEKKGIVYSPGMSDPINERGGRRRRLLCLTEKGELALNLAIEKMDSQQAGLTKILEEARS